MALYSALTEERETFTCFLDFQEMGESPRNMMWSEVERRVAGQLAQSEPQYTVRCNVLEVGRNKPWSGYNLI